MSYTYLHKCRTSPLTPDVYYSLSVVGARVKRMVSNVLLIQFHYSLLSRRRIAHKYMDLFVIALTAPTVKGNIDELS